MKAYSSFSWEQKEKIYSLARAGVSDEALCERYDVDEAILLRIALVSIAEHLGGDFFRVATFDIQSGVLLVYVYTAKLPTLPLDEPVIVRHSLLNIGVYRL